jgi:hypothetical protein
MTDASVVIDIWTSMKEYIPVKDRISAAEHFLTIVSEAGLVDVICLVAARTLTVQYRKLQLTWTFARTLTTITTSGMNESVVQ